MKLFLTEYICADAYYGAQCNIKLTTTIKMEGPTALSISGGVFPSKPSWIYGAIYSLTPTAPSWSIGISSYTNNRPPDMYLRYLAIPTVTQYDVHIQPDTDRSAVFYNSSIPYRETWYIGLSYPSGTVDGGSSNSLILWTGQDCPVNCSAHGSCVNHTCTCDDGWEGDYLCSTVTVHTNGLPQIARALIPIISILGAITLGCLLCMYFKRTPDSVFTMQAQQRGYLLGAASAADGGGPGSGPGGGWSRGLFGSGVGGGSGGGSGGAGPAPSAPSAPAQRPVSQGFGPRGNIHRLA